MVVVLQFGVVVVVPGFGVVVLLVVVLEVVVQLTVVTALGDFDAVWDCLAPREQARVIELLVEQISYDGDGGSISVTFRPTGIKTLASELGARKEEAA